MLEHNCFNLPDIINISNNTINIIKKSEVEAIINTVADVYAQQTTNTLKVYQVKIAQGTHIK